jgi:uncharacterized RDD family membrane protein YckC
MEIWIGRDGERHGPYQEEDVRQWLRSGQVSGGDLAWHEGLADWQPLSALFPEEVRNAAPSTGDSHSPPAAPMQQLPQTTTAALEDHAGFWKRVAAYILDLILLTIVFKVIGTFFGAPAAEEATKQAILGGTPPLEAYMQLYHNLWFYNLLTTVLTWLYFAFCESSAWQATVGKLALGIRVTNLQGSRISFLRATGRFFAKYLSVLILCIGFVMVAFTRRKQGLHDLIADTLVLNGRAGEFKDTPTKSTGGSFSA